MRRHSFTLLELLVSIGIILVLAAITFGGMNYASKRAQEAKTIATMEEFINALESFKQDYGFYPIIDKDEAKEVDLSADGWKLFMNDKSGVTPFNYGLALTKDGTECFRYLGAAGPRHFPCKVTRAGNETFYEVAIPWTELEYTPASGKRIAFSFIVFDRNSEAEVSAPYYIGLTRGIAGGQDASLYKVIVFED